jgi:hypothetical protein
MVAADGTSYKPASQQALVHQVLDLPLSFAPQQGYLSGLPPGLPPMLPSGLCCCTPILSGFSLRRVNDAVHSLCSIEPTNNNLTCNKKINFSKTFKNVERNISKKINTFQTVLTLCSLAISNVFSFSNICSAFNVSSAKQPFITMQVQGVTSSWLFESGAAASVMALTEFQKISQDNRPEKLPAMLNLSTASADSLNVVGVYNLSFSMKGKTIQNPVYVCSNLNQKAIIGMDVIKKFGLIYSPLKETLRPAAARFFPSLLPTGASPRPSLIVPQFLQRASPCTQPQNSSPPLLFVLHAFSLKPIIFLSLHLWL